LSSTACRQQSTAVAATAKNKKAPVSTQKYLLLPLALFMQGLEVGQQIHL